VANQDAHDSVIPRREELLQAAAVGLDLVAQAMKSVSAATLRAAEALQAAADSLTPDEEPPVAPPEPTPTGPTMPRGPLDPPVPPDAYDT
jgi:hypothetical protein